MSHSRKTISAMLLLVLASTGLAQTKQLPLVWEYAAPRVFPQAILRDELGRDFLHVALKNGGLAILDISKPEVAPRQITTIETASLAGLDVMHLTQQKDVLYLALGDFFNAGGAPAGLAIVSVAQPREPKILSVWKSEKKLQGAATVVVKGKYAYLGAMNHGVFVLDVSDPRKIAKMAEILPDVDFPLKSPSKIQHPNARGFALHGQHLYVAFDAGGLRVIDIEYPLKPREVGRYINRGMGKKQQAYNTS